MNPKKRLDVLLVERGLVESRERARGLILSGVVFVNGERLDKAGQKLSEDVEIDVKDKGIPFVSRGGLKIEGALDFFNIDPTDKHCLDVGQSTGGFTDCLLQRGAASVVGVDVGYGQVALKVRNDPRVTVIERTNFRYFDPGTLERPVDLAVVDVSFISLELILPVVEKCLAPGGLVIALIKPQFEVGKGLVGSQGVVRDESLHEKVVQKVCDFAMENLGLIVKGTGTSPIQGPKGNREFFCLLEKKAS